MSTFSRRLGCKLAQARRRKETDARGRLARDADAASVDGSEVFAVQRSVWYCHRLEPCAPAGARRALATLRREVVRSRESLVERQIHFEACLCAASRFRGLASSLYKCMGLEMGVRRTTHHRGVDGSPARRRRRRSVRSCRARGRRVGLGSLQLHGVSPLLFLSKQTPVASHTRSHQLIANLNPAR